MIKSFLIIDGYTGILDPNEKFAQNLRKITCPRYEKEKKRLDSVEWVNDMISNFWDLSDEEMDKTFFHNPAFEDAKESLKQAYDLMQEIGRFKLLGNGDVIFLETLYQMKI